MNLAAAYRAGWKTAGRHVGDCLTAVLLVHFKTSHSPHPSPSSIIRGTGAGGAGTLGLLGHPELFTALEYF